MKKISIVVLCIFSLLSCEKNEAPASVQLTVVTNLPVALSCTSVELSGMVDGPKANMKATNFGVVYSNSADVSIENGTVAYAIKKSSSQNFIVCIEGLVPDSQYYYKAFAKDNAGDFIYGDVVSFRTLKLSAPANCFIVVPNANVSFKVVEGNSSDKIDGAQTACVLWESFGTNEKPQKGDVISNVFLSESGSDCYLTVCAGNKEGNALVAVKNDIGEVLWSWHIWVTSADLNALAQKYNNNAGTMMDRNLGALSATPGDVKALGLLYQWGRKDPFLNADDIHCTSLRNQTPAVSTITWPGPNLREPLTGTIAFSVRHPTMYIYDYTEWLYSSDDTLWHSGKGKYDPCPAGWCVPDGGIDNIWLKAFKTYLNWTTLSNWDSTNEGMDFSKTDKTLSDANTVWYPASGLRVGFYQGEIQAVGTGGYYWTCSASDIVVGCFRFHDTGAVCGLDTSLRPSNAASVRCQKME